MKSLARQTAALLLVLSCALSPTAALAQDAPAYSQQQLDQILAPIALYPDPLLSQILMASTYPVEVAEAARWSRRHPELQGDDAVRAVAQENWDPSVKSLVAFPQVVAWMDENPEWTRALGDAFLAQEPHVMETVQDLRRRAQSAGTLRSDERMRVVDDSGGIALLPADAQIIDVPYYDPLLAFGTWWWPAYPPAHWRTRPGYFVRPGHAGFFWGPRIAVSTGFFFGACDWHRRQVRVAHVDNYYYRTTIANRQAAVGAQAIVAGPNQAPGVWQHNPAHRRGIAYRNAAAQGFAWTPRAQRPDVRRDDATRQVQPPQGRGASIPSTASRSDARIGGRPPITASPTARSDERRREGRTAQAAVGFAPRVGPEVARARDQRPPHQRVQPLQPAPAVQTAQPAIRAPVAGPAPAVRARPWRAEGPTDHAQARREAGPRLESQRTAAPRAEARPSHESRTPAATAVNPEAGNSGNREQGRSSEHRGRSEGREGNRGPG